MRFDRPPEFRRSVGGPYRSMRWQRAIEWIFSGVAKATLAIAMLIAIALAVLSGSPDGLVSLPDTRKGWLRLILFIVLAVVLVLVALMLAGRASSSR
jgi:hypothetical protein